MSDSIFHHPATGKGDAPRKTNKRAFDRNYLRLYGEPCPVCNITHGELKGKLDLGEMLANPAEVGRGAEPVWVTCTNCDGLGYVEKSHGRR